MHSASNSRWKYGTPRFRHALDLHPTSRAGQDGFPGYMPRKRISRAVRDSTRAIP